MVYGVMSELFEDEETAMERLRARFDIDDAEAASLVFQVKNKVNTPITSSAGRLFDVAAALAGLRGEASYDGQAACELEAVARDIREYYNFILDRSAEPWVVDTRPVFREMLIDIDSGKAPAEVAGKFHATMALAIIETCEAISDATGLGRVALSGGVFQNEMLATWAVDGLTSSGLAVMVHGRVPCNDGGVSLGQAVVAARLS
jgi:hydrogenase maturation protein HypF